MGRAPPPAPPAEAIIQKATTAFSLPLQRGRIQRWGYFLCVTRSFGVLFLTETVSIGGCVGVYVDVCLEFFLIFLCGYWVIFNSVYSLKKYSLINPSAFNLKDKQSLCNSRSLPRAGVVFPEVSSPELGNSGPYFGLTLTSWIPLLPLGLSSCSHILYSSAPPPFHSSAPCSKIILPSLLSSSPVSKIKKNNNNKS